MSHTEYCRIRNLITGKFFKGKNNRSLWRFKHHAQESFRNNMDEELDKSTNYKLEYFVLVPYLDYYDKIN